MDQFTLVKVVQSILIDGDVSEYVFENFANRLSSECQLENEDGECITGELMEGYIKDIVVMTDDESDDVEQVVGNVPHQLEQLHVNLNRKKITLDDVIQLGDKPNERYTIVRLNKQILLCHHQTKECRFEDAKLYSLEETEQFLAATFPDYKVLTKIVERSNN